MQNKKLGTEVADSRITHGGYHLLDALYEGIAEPGARARFLEEFAKELGVQELSVVLYRLEDGASVAFNNACGDHLFSEPNDSELNESPGPELRYASPAGDLLFYSLNEQHLQKVAVTWSRGSALVQLLVSADLDLEDFYRRQRELLSYLLPHFASLYTIFLKRHAAAPRLNAIRSLHAMLPLPLAISRKSDSSLILNAQALRLVNASQTRPRSANLPALANGWRIVRRNPSVSLQSLSRGHSLPLFPLHNLQLQSGGEYEVHLVGEAALDSARLSERLLMDCFKLTAAEAELCGLALQGKGAREIAELSKLSINTIKARFKTIYRALGVGSVAQLVVRLYFHPAYWTANHGRRLQAQALQNAAHSDNAQ